MELSASQDVAVPPGAVWSEIGDMAALARRLRIRSVAIEDPEAGRAPVPGREWPASVEVNGIVQEGVLRVRDASPPDRLAVEGDFGTLAADLLVEITALSAAASRVDLTVRARAAGLRGRMLLQGLRLTRTALEAKLAERLAHCAREIEAARA